jgi:hypothetical protein
MFVTKLADINMDEMTQELTANVSTTATDGDIFAEMVNFFQTDNWQFFPIPGKPSLQTSCQGSSGSWLCYATARIDQQQFVFYSVCPFKTPEDQRIAMAEFITRVNAIEVIGNFEMDFTDGEVRYKTSIDVEGTKLNFALIRQLVYINVTTMDEYLTGILSIIYGILTPLAAIDLLDDSSES